MNRGRTVLATTTRLILPAFAVLSLIGGPSAPAHAGPTRKAPPTPDVAGSKPKYNRKYVIDNFMRKLGDGTEPYVGRRALVQTVLDRLTTPSGRANVLLSAEAGSGKDAVIEEVAKILAERGGSIFEIDLEKFMADVNYDGELKARWISILAAFLDRPNEWVFINEIHRLHGMGTLKDSLKIPTSNDRLKVIAAGTPDEIREGEIDKDVALMSRFKKVDIPTATFDELTTILRQMKREGEEKKFGVESTVNLIPAAARAALEFFPDRPAIRAAQDLYRDTLAMVRSERLNGSLDLRNKEDRQEQLQLELHELEGELTHHKPLVEVIDGKPVEKDSFERTAIKKMIESVQNKLKDVETEMDLIRAQDDVRKLPALQEKYLRIIKDLQAKNDRGERLSREDMDTLLVTQGHLLPDAVLRMQQATLAPGEVRVTEHDLARLVASQLGVAPDLVTANTYQRVRRMEAALGRVVGHDDVKKMILDDVRRTSSQMVPVVGLQGLYVLDGSTGSGKTELAQAIAEGSLGSRENLITIPFAELHEHSVMRVLGSGAGLVNSEEGSIYESVRQNPTSVVNADEIDKTHRKIIDLHHRVFDKGFLKDARNRNIDFRQVRWIGTSNYTGNYAVYKDLTTDNRAIEIDLGLTEGSLKDLPPGAERDAQVLILCMLKKNISASMSSRMRNRRIVSALKPEGARNVVKIMVEDVVRSISDRKQWSVQIGEGVTDFISDSAFSWYGGGRFLTMGVENMLTGNLTTLEYHLQEQNALQIEEVAKHNSTNPTDKRLFKPLEPGLGTVIAVDLEDAKTKDGDAIANMKSLKFSMYVPAEVPDDGKPGKLLFSQTVHYPIPNFGPEPKLTMADVAPPKANASSDAKDHDRAKDESPNTDQLDMFGPSCEPALQLAPR